MGCWGTHMEDSGEGHVGQYLLHLRGHGHQPRLQLLRALRGCLPSPAPPALPSAFAPQPPHSPRPSSATLPLPVPSPGASEPQTREGQRKAPGPQRLCTTVCRLRLPQCTPGCPWATRTNLASHLSPVPCADWALGPPHALRPCSPSGSRRLLLPGPLARLRPLHKLIQQPRQRGACSCLGLPRLGSPRRGVASCGARALGLLRWPQGAAARRARVGGRRALVQPARHSPPHQTPEPPPGLLARPPARRLSASANGASAGQP